MHVFIITNDIKSNLPCNCCCFSLAGIICIGKRTYLELSMIDNGSAVLCHADSDV